ncbi:MAG: DUF1361 domain-containing protein [Verrucomicrobia bacterium]|nr:DUF1361 domain-containing protein [Verrucomicrobiota bacterium]
MTERADSKPSPSAAAAKLAVLPDPSPETTPPPSPRWNISSLLRKCDQLVGVPIARHAAPCLVASALACLIVASENIIGPRHRQWYLVYNLILAWIPLGWACLVVRMSRQEVRNPFIFWSCAVLWLLFLPNAPYLFTDLVHLLGKSLPYYWSDMMKILLFALAGMTAGLLSLRLMHALVEAAFGRWMGWGFVAAISALSSMGVALGRFNRWNSWDVLRQPTSVLRDAFDFTQITYVTNPKGLFAVFLAALVFCFYLILFGFEEPADGTKPKDSTAR